MTTQEMLDLMRQRTKVADTSKLLIELRSAYRWAVRRIYNAAGGPDLLSTFGEELDALAQKTRDFDLGAAVDGDFLGIKKLWLKLPGDVKFTQMNEVDGNDLRDEATAANPTIASGHTVDFTVVNFGKLRFAPALPSGSVLRADYFRAAVVPDPTTNNVQDNGIDLPVLFHDCVCSKAIAQMFGTLDDTREGSWETRARDELNDAIYAATTRTQGPTRTQGYRRRR